MKNILWLIPLILGMSTTKTVAPKSTYINPTTSPYAFQVERWNQARISPDWVGRVSQVEMRILAHKERYRRVAEDINTPWEVVASIHNMESGGNFSRHMHEGSPLSGRTKYVPKGRPSKGDPPFTWEESTYDALVVLKGFDDVDWSDIGVTLQTLEKYNGLGYQKYHSNVPSPYIVSGTNLAKAGKYVADGKWDPYARSKQVGCLAILKVLKYSP